MEDANSRLLINANVEIEAEALQTIVRTAKSIAGHDEKGRYHLDTAAIAGDMISRFLEDKDFLSFVKEPGNYRL